MMPHPIHITPESRKKLTIRLPLTIALSMLMQAALVLVWATQLDARVNGVEQQVINNRGVSEKLARLEERLDDVRESVSDIRQQVGELTRRLIKP
jgi:hypothetical protein